MGGAARQGEAAVPWLLTVLVMWLLAAWREREGEPIPASRLLRELKANVGSDDILPRAWRALEELDESEMLEVSGERGDPLLALNPRGVRALEHEDAATREAALARGTSVEAMGIRGPYAGARVLAMGYLRLLRGEGPRLAKR